MIVQTAPRALFLLIWLALAGAAQAVISYNPQDWPAYTLKFSTEGTLKDVYDSGLRPWLAPGFETSFLRFKHARITVQTHEGITLPEFPVEYADIYCTRDGRLHSIHMTSPGFPFASIRDLIIPWLPMIGKNEDQLNAFFKFVSEDPIGYEDPNFGKAPGGFRGGWIDSGKTDYGLGLRNNKNPNIPLYITYSVGWYKLRSNRDRSDVHLDPIKPPPEYENEPLTPPKNWGPDSELEKARALDLDTGESPEAVAEQRRNGERPPLKPGDPPLGRPDPDMPVMSPAPVSRFFFWLLPAMLVGGFVIIALIFRALRTGK